jgi:hypothetical protein
MLWIALATVLPGCHHDTDDTAKVAAKPPASVPMHPPAASATSEAWNPFASSATSTAPEPAASDVTSTTTIAAKGDALQDFTLSMARVDAYLSATRNIAALVHTDPSLGSIAAMDVSNEDAAQYSTRVDQHPEIVAAISDAGLSPREFALTGEALVTAMMTESALESGALKQIPANVNPQLVEFVRQNKSALNAKWKSPQASD